MSMFMTQMLQNTGLQFGYPFRKKGNEKCEEIYLSFEEVLQEAFQNPEDFILSDDDKSYYSEQELRLIESVIAEEKKKIEKGYTTISLDISEEAENMLYDYSKIHNMTIEESIIEIIEKCVKLAEEVKQE